MIGRILIRYFCSALESQNKLLVEMKKRGAAPIFKFPPHNPCSDVRRASQTSLLYVRLHKEESMI